MGTLRPGHWRVSVLRGEPGSEGMGGSQGVPRGCRSWASPPTWSCHKVEAGLSEECLSPQGGALALDSPLGGH